jgi:hypothetical protein
MPSLTTMYRHIDLFEPVRVIYSEASRVPDSQAAHDLTKVLHAVIIHENNSVAPTKFLRLASLAVPRNRGVISWSLS